MLAAVLGDPLARGLAGQLLVGGAEVHRGAEVLVLVDAGVEGHDRDLGGLGGLHRRGERVRGRQGGGDAVHLGVDGVLDQRRLLAGVRVVGVLQVDAVVLRGLRRPGLDLVPEGVTRRLVGDHGDGVAGVVAGAAAAPAATARGCPAAARHAGGQDDGEHDGQEQCAASSSSGLASLVGSLSLDFICRRLRWWADPVSTITASPSPTLLVKGLF